MNVKVVSASAEADRATEAMRLLVEELCREHQVPGVAAVIVRDGSIVGTAAAGVANARTGQAMSADATFDMASQTKLLTTLALLELESQGRLTLRASLLDFLPAHAFLDPVRAAGTTLESCLTHQAGFAHVTRSRVMYRPLHASGLSTLRRKSATVDVLSDGPIAQPIAGVGVSQYSNVGAAIAASVLMRVTGLDYSDAVSALVLEPLAMTSTQLGAGSAPEGRRHRRGIGPELFPRWKGIAGGVSTVADFGRLVAPYTTRQDSSRSRRLHESVEVSRLRGASNGHVVGWRLEQTSQGQVLHQAGTRPGLSVKMMVRPGLGVGCVLLSNASCRLPLHAAAENLLATTVGPPMAAAPAMSVSSDLLGDFRLQGSPADNPTFWLDCRHRLSLRAQGRHTVVISGRSEHRAVLARGSELGFITAGAWVPIHVIREAGHKVLVLGGPYTGLRLLESSL